MSLAKSRSSSSTRWIAAAKRLRENPKVHVACPDCNVGYLETTTVDWPDGSHTDVYMKCSKCGSSNVMTFPKDSQSP